MSSNLLALLIVISFLAAVFKKNRSSVLALSATVLWYCFVGTGIFTRTLINQLETQPRVSTPVWKQKNLIVVLAGGKQQWDSNEFSTQSLAVSRVLETTRLYNYCKQSGGTCRILVSGGDPTHQGISEAEVMMKEFSENGIPAEAVLTEIRSLNTYQNAKFSEGLIKEGSYDQVYLVTSGTHLARALIMFSHFGINPLPAPSDHLQARLGFNSFAVNFFLTDIALHEFGGILQYYVYNLLGYNS